MVVACSRFAGSLKRRALLLLFGVLFLLGQFACAAAGKPAGETGGQMNERLEWFQDQRYGMFIHWGPSVIHGGKYSSSELSWSRAGNPPDAWHSGGPIPEDIYDASYKHFDPVHYDPAEWVQLAKDAGMKYMVLTARHHDSFSMFDTAYSDFKITNPEGAYRKRIAAENPGLTDEQINRKADIVRQYADAVRAGGLGLGLYYSEPDWVREDYRIALTGKNGAGQEVSPEAQQAALKSYQDFMHAQLEELTTKYGRVDSLWFDAIKPSQVAEHGWGAIWIRRDTLDMLRRNQPGILINDRHDFEPDYRTPEGTDAQYIPGQVQESCQHMGRQWSWWPDDRVPSVKWIIDRLVINASRNSNVLLNLGPSPEGVFDPRQAERIRQAGAWLARHSEAIFGTRGGPVFNNEKDPGFVTMQKDQQIFVHVLHQKLAGSEISLPGVTIASAHVYGSPERKVAFRQDGQNAYLRVPETLDEINQILTVERKAQSEAAAVKAEESLLQKKMIWTGEPDSERNCFRAFRKTFTLEAAPKKAVLNIFADNRYLLWINDTYIKRGPIRFDPKGPEYDSVDVQPFLKKGANVIAVQVMAFRSGTGGQRIRHVPGLTAELVVDGATVLATDPSWKWSSQTQYGDAHVGWGFVRYANDGRNEPLGWAGTGFDDSQWQAAVPIDGSQWGPMRAVSMAPLPEQTAVVNPAVILPKGVSYPITLAEKESVTVDLGRMVMGYEVITLEAQAGAVLQVEHGQRFAEKMSDTYGSINTYTARDGRQVFMAADSYGHRYLQLAAKTGSITLHEIKVVERLYPYEETGSFESNDAFLNELWKRAVHTLRMNCEDGYLDCPLRERAEWMGDAAVVQYPCSRVVFGIRDASGTPRSDAGLIKLIIRHTAQSQQEDGRLKAHVPSDRWDKHGYIEDYSCLWVQMVRDVYDHTGDVDLVKEVWPALVGQMQWFLDRRTSRGLVNAREFVIFDNPQAYNVCEGATLNAFVYKALRDSAYLAGVVGDNRKQSEYTAAAEALYTAFNNLLWDASTGNYYAGLDSPDDVPAESPKKLKPSAHSAMIPLHAGIVPPERIESVRNFLFSTWSSSIGMPYTHWWLFEEFSKADDPPRDVEALNSIRTKWAPVMARTDTGTFTEGYNGGEASHNFGSSPLYYLQTRVLGVSMDGPVWDQRIRIEPRLGDLTSVQGTVVTEHGPVAVSWTRTGERWEYSFTVPEDVKAAVRLPVGKTFEKAVLDGRSLTAGLGGVEHVGRWLEFTVGPGQHSGYWLVSTDAEPPFVNASWIGLEEPAGANAWLCYRKAISLEDVPEKVFADVACDSKYWLWINEELVVLEGQLKRGPTPDGTYFDKVEIGKYLKKGDNQIAVLVWYFGKNGFSHNSSGKAGLVFQADCGTRAIVSDSSWKVLRHPAFGGTGKPHPNFRLPESNIRFDARKDIGGWTSVSFDDSAWPNAADFGRPPAAPWGPLYERPILQWKDFGLTDYVGTERQVDGEKVKLVCKLPYNAQVTPYLKVTAPAGRVIDIRTDNYMGGSVPNVRAEYVTADGEQEFEAFGWMNGHEVHYTLPADVKVLAVKYRQTGYNADFVGSFRCEDEKLNTLWEKSLRTLYITMRDTYMDCPDRERAQWWGDVVNELGEAFYVFDAQKGPMLARKAIYELAGWQRKDKVLFSPVPAGVPGGSENPEGTWDKELPPQMLASVGWYGFWTYYLYTGDRQTIADVYPNVRDYLSLWKLNDDGLVIHRPGDWDWTDWGENIDAAVTDSAWMHLALKAAAAMAELTGNSADVAGYRDMMASIEANFNRVYWQGDKYRSPSYKGQTDDRANAMAVVAGLAKAEYYPAIRDVLRNEYHASPYMEKYVLEAIYLMDAPGEAIARMKKRFAAQIDSPLTTLWEGWGIGEEGFGGGTYNHAWSGGALTILSQYAAGVAPVEPAFREFSVLPQMGPLKSIKTLVPTIYGNIELELAGQPSFGMNLTVPEGTTAYVGVPKSGNPARVCINGKAVYEQGTGSSPAFVKEDLQRIHFKLAAGQWKIETE
jgi:alpha-L-rhamnosidase